MKLVTNDNTKRNDVIVVDFVDKIKIAHFAKEVIESEKGLHDFFQIKALVECRFREVAQLRLAKSALERRGIFTFRT